MSVLSVIRSTRSGILAGFLLSAEFLNQCDIFFQSLDEYLFQSFSWLFRGEGACLLLCYKVRLPQNCPLLTPPLWFYSCAFRDMQEWHMSNCRFGILGLLLTDGLCVKAICWDPPSLQCHANAYLLYFINPLCHKCVTGWSNKTVTTNFFLTDQNFSKSAITQLFLGSFYRAVLVFWCFKSVKWVEFWLSKLFQ